MASAGILSVVDLISTYKGLKEIIWVVEETSRHMDWTDDAADQKAPIRTSIWHELIEAKRTVATLELPERGSEEPKSLVSIWQSERDHPGTIVEFTQGVRRPPSQLSRLYVLTLSFRISSPPSPHYNPLCLRSNVFAPRIWSYPSTHSPQPTRSASPLPPCTPTHRSPSTRSRDPTQISPSPYAASRQR